MQERFPGTEILIHVDPEGQTDRETLLPQEITEQADMTSLPFFQVDAFADRPLTGNPGRGHAARALARRRADAGDRGRE